MSKEENIRAILKCCFAGFKDEIIDIAVKEILKIKCDDDIADNEQEVNKVLTDIKTEIEQNMGDNIYKNDGLYRAWQIIDKHTKGDTE